MSARRPLDRFIALFCFALLFPLFQPDAVAQNQGGSDGNAQKKEEPSITPMGTGEGGSGCPDCVPLVMIDDGGASVVFSSTFHLKVYWCDDASLTSGSRWVKRNGSSVTSQLNYSYSSSIPCNTTYRRVSEGTVTLEPGTNTFTARICNSEGNCARELELATVVYENREPPTIALNKHNGDNRDRSLCLTSGAGEGAAYQCGDLLVAHSMPAYATKGRNRSLTLLYNSDQAAPRAVVTAEIGMPVGHDPDEIEVLLKMGSVTVASALYPLSSWQGQTHQVSLGYSASSLSTGLYPFTLVARAIYAPTKIRESTISDTLIVVNRSDSEFGQGWSLAGIERLVLNQPAGTGEDILWVGGDGSAKRYRKVAPNTWEGAAGAYRDTITLSGNIYTRHLKHGVKVEFWNQGLHIRTINRAQDTTRIKWGGGRIATIQVATAGATTRDTYTLHYSGAPTALDSIVDPTGRVLAATVNAAGRLTGLTDPDGEGVTFTYNTSEKMASRMNRRGFQTGYWYDNDHRLTDVKIMLDASGPDWAHTRFTNWDESWLALGVDATPEPRLTNVHTIINGPRTGNDFTGFWIDRWGAPTRIQDPLLENTYVTRGGGSSPPALPTKIEYPNGRVVTMQWNNRANLILQTDSATTAETRWTYNFAGVKADSPDSLVAPDGEVTRFTYTTDGLADRVTAPNGHVTDFDYGSGNLKGLLTKVTEESVPVLVGSSWSDSNEDIETTFNYDDWGNVETQMSPLGNTTTYVRDDKNRVDLVIDAVGDTTGRTYDDLNRVTATHAYTAGGVLTTTRDWGIDFLDEVIDPRGVTRGFEYDDAGRLVKEIDEQGAFDKFGYDEAGNRIWAFTRLLQSQNDTIYFGYDVAGQLKKKHWPAISYPNSVPDYTFTAPADSLVYSYDEMGRIETVQNFASSSSPAFTIARTYRDDGLLLSEMRTDGGTGRTASVRYDYSPGGKRTLQVVGDPSNPSATAADSVWHSYHPSTGELEKTVVEWGYGSSHRDSVRFTWDDLGRRKRLLYSSHSGTTAPIDVKFSYDMQGRLRRICSTHGGNVNPSHSDVFDLREARFYNDDGTLSMRTMRDTTGGASTDTVCPYSNYVVRDIQTGYEYDEQKQITVEDGNEGYTEIDYDDSGNAIHRAEYFSQGGSVRAMRRFVVPDSSNRIDTFWADTVHIPGSNYDYTYHDNGTRALDEHSAGWGHRWYLLDGLGRLAGVTWHDTCIPTISFRLDEAGALHRPYYDGNCQASTVFSSVPTCNYDPFGRLVDPCGTAISRLTFDGDNVVRTGEDQGEWDWSFVHGPGLDDPLMGHKKLDSAGGHAYYYFITDGAGRQLAVADSGGEDAANPHVDDPDPPTGGSRAMPYMAGAQFAGGIHSSFGFTAERHPSDDLPGLAFFRNRWYDQATSRWLAEDPIGLAGGVNLYQYAGNNPATYTDPFGLCPDKKRKDTICVAFFIQAESAGGLRGDARGFSTSSPSGRSRGYIVVDVANQRVVDSGFSPTCTVGGDCSGPSSLSRIDASFGRGGKIHVSAVGHNSKTTVPAFSASLVFTPDGSGGFSADGFATRFPSIEAYHFDGSGNASTLLQQSEGHFTCLTQANPTCTIGRVGN